MDPMSAVAPYNHEGVPDQPTALLVIDMQEHFADIATPILPALSSLVMAARNADIQVSTPATATTICLWTAGSWLRGGATT